MIILRYLVHGGELFQTQEAVMSIKHNCLDNGYTKHEVFEIVNGFDWLSLKSAICELDMFADKKFIEVRLNATLTKSDQKAFEQILDLQGQEIVILVVAKKLNQDVLNTSWVKKILQSGKIIEVKSIPNYQWLPWVAKRLDHMQLKATPDAIDILAKSYEGNLVDLHQVLISLQSNHKNELITAEICQLYVQNSSVLSVFELSQAIMMADKTRILSTLESLQNNQVEPSLVLWSVTKELRLLIKLAIEVELNKNINDDFLCKKYNIWPKNITRYKNLLQKNTAKELKKMISFAHKIDLSIKGAEHINVFESICMLCFKLVSSNLNMVINEGVN